MGGCGVNGGSGGPRAAAQPSLALTAFLRLASTSEPESEPEELLSEPLASSDEVSARPFLPCGAFFFLAFFAPSSSSSSLGL